jgi:hypothetical protein
MFGIQFFTYHLQGSLLLLFSLHYRDQPAATQRSCESKMVLSIRICRSLYKSILTITYTVFVKQNGTLLVMAFE